jgi:hypothetical protein
MPRQWPTLSVDQAGSFFRSFQAACNRPASVREVFLLALLTLSIFWAFQRPHVAVYVPDVRIGHIVT